MAKNKVRKHVRKRPAETGAAVLGILATIAAVLRGDADVIDGAYTVIGLAPGAITWFKVHILGQ